MPVRHVTTTPDTVEVVTLPNDHGTYAVFHRANPDDAPMWVTAGANPADPVPNGDDCWVVPAGTRRVLHPRWHGPTVKLLCAGTATVEVEAS